MGNKSFTELPVNLFTFASDSSQSVDGISPLEIDTAANILSEAYTEDPLFVWAMPKAATRQADARIFFSFFLQRIRPHLREIVQHLTVQLSLLFGGSIKTMVIIGIISAFCPRSSPRGHP